MTRLQTLKAQLADEGGTPLMWDTWHQTLYKLALAQGVEFENCCQWETRYQLENLIESAEGAASTPDSIPGLLAWWDASVLGYPDSTSIDNATFPFVDQTGNGYDGTQATGSARPVLRTGILNGKSVVRFDGTTDFLSYNTITIPGYTGGVDSDLTVIFIGTSTNDGMILGLSSSNVQVRVGRSGANVISNFFGSSDVVSLAFTNLASTVRMHTWRRTGILIKHRENVTDKTGIIPIPNPTDGSAFTLNQMGHYWAGNFLAGDIGEILVYNAYLTDAQLNDLYVDYFHPKWWDIPANALLDEDGNPILTENGDFILIE